MSQTLTDKPAASTSLFGELRQDDFRNCANSMCFEFTHNLAGHPLFTMPRILEAVRRLPSQVYHDLGNVKVNDRWDQMPERKLTAEETLQRIEDVDGWVMLKHAEKDPDYDVLLQTCLSEIESRTGVAFRKIMRSNELIIFVTSPNRITPYHLDRECNFLLQTHGTKEIHIFNGADRSIVTERELELFWTVDNNCAIYKPESEGKGMVFKLVPGNGVHIPVNFPHWVKNSNNISVSISINFQFRDSALADIYRANRLLRRFGVSPVPPGQSKLRDTIKASAYGSMKTIKGLAKNSK